MTPHLDILPPGQRTFWQRFAGAIPRHYVLYGGTAVALRYGHRQSIDFDFFTDRPLDWEDLNRSAPVLKAAELLARRPDTLLLRLDMDGAPIKLSFFGGLGFGRVGVPDAIEDGAAIASPLDLLATKLKALHDVSRPRTIWTSTFCCDPASP